MNTNVLKFHALVGSTLIFTSCNDKRNDQIAEQNITCITNCDSKEIHSLEELITISGISKENTLTASDTMELIRSSSPSGSTMS